jgi:DNA-binding NarL/FixJ family response regulator
VKNLRRAGLPDRTMSEELMKINLLVADDHAVIREGIAAILKGSDIEVVAEAETGNQAIEQAMKLKPDVVLLDVRMPDTDGL